MKKVLILFGLICCSLFTLQAKVGAPVAMTPFTGTNYVRVKVDAGFRSAASNTFKAAIRSIEDGKILWQGPVSLAADGKQLSFTVKDLKPVLWTPGNPYLYEITLQKFEAGKARGELKERAGFRSFASQNGHFYLNGKPIFLRGIAINPPERGIPKELETSRAFALDYVRYMKSIHVNIIRIPDNENWYDVCDELGMMVFGGNYSEIVDGQKPPKDYDKAVDWYKYDKFGAIAHHPSLMVYAMTNETPFQGKEVPAWEKFLSYTADKLKQWDETRVYIANAGYGYGKAGDVCDIHRYWGWYYSSPYTFLHIRYNEDIIPITKKAGQPVTFTECVGNYTGPDGRYNLTPAHKNPASQLAWTGHERDDLQAQLADEHQCTTLRNATESFRQLRLINPDLSGVFPFTILFYNWDTINKFDDMKPKPVASQVKLSYQPVLLSWECWTSQIYAGSTIKPIAHIINDDDNFQDLKNAKLIYQIKDKAKQTVFADSIALADVPYYGSSKKQLNITLPANLVSGDYELTGTIISAGKKVSENNFKLFIADQSFQNPPVPVRAKVLLYDKEGKTKAAFQKLHIAFQDIVTIPASFPVNSVLVIGENSADAALQQKSTDIKQFMAKGGRVLCLRQNTNAMPNMNALLQYPVTNDNIDIDDPVYPVSAISPRNGYSLNPERPEHPVFVGINRENLRTWSDYTGWDESQKGFPAIHPVTDGFMLQDKFGWAATAVLADYSSGLQGLAIAEQFNGTGSILLCALDLANRAGLDPVADRMLLNLVSYTGNNNGHEAYSLITAPIIWGEYETERGVVSDIYSGFLVNATPRVTPEYQKKGIVVGKDGYQLAGGRGSGFNTRPGLQYVANGRRPFGPYTQSFGGQPRITDTTNHAGTGRFWCRVPEGSNVATSVVWNPSGEPLDIIIKINDLPEVKQQIKPGDKMSIEAPVNSANVDMTYRGDRRLVVLETSFKQKN